MGGQRVQRRRHSWRRGDVVLAVIITAGAGLVSLGPFQSTQSGSAPNSESGVPQPPLQVRIRSPQAAPRLGTDASSPLFMEMNMAPGHTATRCVSVRNLGLQRADVRLSATTEDEGLARNVLMAIEAGRGGDYGDCSGFEGDVIFRGTLAQLAGEHRDFATGLAAPFALGSGSSMSYRFTQQLADSTPQGRAARAGFIWQARAMTSPPATSDDEGAAADVPAPAATDPSGRTTAPATEGRNTDRIAAETGGTGVAVPGWSWLLLVVLLLLALLFLFLLMLRRRRDPDEPEAVPEPLSDIDPGLLRLALRSDGERRVGAAT